MLQVGLPALAAIVSTCRRSRAGPAGRARAHNMLENLALFASLVLVAQVAGKANATTALGAELFLLGAADLRAGVCRRHPVSAHRRLGGVGRRVVMIFLQLV